MGNAEGQDFLADVTETNNDLAKLMPVLSNLPLINVLVQDTYKCRALIDTGSTNCVLSTALVERMPAVKG